MNEDLNPSEAENIVIGQVLYEPECIGRAARILMADHFFGLPHRTTFSAAMDLWRSGTPVDLVTMTTELRKRGELDTVGGPYQLSDWMRRVSQTTHLEAHAHIIREYFSLRTLRNMGKEVASTTNVSGEVSEIMATVSGAMSKAAVADIETDINAGERAYEMQNEGEKPKPYYLGMDSVDSVVFIRPGNVLTVSAPSGVGKTAFVLCAVLNLIERLKPWFVSLEMPADELITRALCQLAQVDIDLAMEDRLDADQRERMAKAAIDHADMLSRLDIDDTGSMTIDQFQAKAEHKVRNEGVGLIVVDYAQLMEADRKTYGNEALQNEAISKGIRSTARRLNVPILLVVHLNRAGEAHGSTQYEKDAHVRLKLFREPGNAFMEVDVVKNRNGRCERVNTPCDMRYGLVGRSVPTRQAPKMPRFPINPDKFTTPLRDETIPF